MGSLVWWSGQIRSYSGQYNGSATDFATLAYLTWLLSGIEAFYNIQNCFKAFRSSLSTFRHSKAVLFLIVFSSFSQFW